MKKSAIRLTIYLALMLSCLTILDLSSANYYVSPVLMGMIATALVSMLVGLTASIAFHNKLARV